MAYTPAVAGLTPQQWDDEFFTDYIRMSRYKRYFGTDESAMFQINEQLTAKRGDAITFALVNELVGAGVTGSNTLKGNEEKLNSRSHKLTVDVLRHAVAVDNWDEQKSVVDLRNAAKSMLRQWAQVQLRDGCTTALGMIDGIVFSTATNANRDTWYANNLDRIVVGTSAAVSQTTFASGVSAATVATQLSPNILSLLKRMAQKASPKIKPIYVKEMDQEWYVAFIGSAAWRDLTEDNPTTNLLTLSNRDARVRGVDNPLFTGDSLVWDGIILREIPEIAALPTAVASVGVRVEPVYLCGAQAVGLAWAQRTTSRTDVDDYGFVNGCAVQEIRRIEKLRFGTGSSDLTTPKDHGIATAFVAAAAD